MNESHEEEPSSPFSSLVGSTRRRLLPSSFLVGSKGEGWRGTVARRHTVAWRHYCSTGTVARVWWLPPCLLVVTMGLGPQKLVFSHLKNGLAGQSSPQKSEFFFLIIFNFSTNHLCVLCLHRILHSTPLKQNSPSNSTCRSIRKNITT